MLSSPSLPVLPPPVDLETVPVLKALALANRALAELKGRASTIPNPAILIDTLSLQEAMASSEIENIVTTQDELFRAALFPEAPGSTAAKEVARYSATLKLGHERLRHMKGIISNNTLIEMFGLLKGTDEGFRVTPGTVLRNETTGETVYVPPQDAREIAEHMASYTWSAQEAIPISSRKKGRTHASSPFALAVGREPSSLPAWPGQRAASSPACR